MFKFIAKRKFNQVMREMRSFGYIHPLNWDEMKRLHIKAMVLGCMVHLGSHNDPGWAVMQAQELINESQEDYAKGGMFPEQYAELVIAIGAEVSQLPQHYRDTAARLEELRRRLS